MRARRSGFGADIVEDHLAGDAVGSDIGADPQGEGRDGDRGENGGLAKAANGVTEIGQHLCQDNVRKSERCRDTVYQFLTPSLHSKGGQRKHGLQHTRPSRPGDFTGYL